MNRTFFHQTQKYGLLCFVCFGLIFQACTKKPGQIGESLQPDQDLILLQYTDSVAIEAYSLREDSVRTDKPEKIVLGANKDPIFGTTVAGFYTQFRLSTANHDFGSNPQLDSLVLQLAYDGYYGDTTTTQNIGVYELLDDMYSDSAYYSNRHLEHASTDLANFSFKPKPRSNFVFGKDTLAPAVRIRLSDLSPELGNKLLSATEETHKSDTAFKSFFKGLYLVASPVSSGGSLSMFNLGITLSRMTVYYRNDEQDSLRYEYSITSNEAKFNTYEHFNYQDADPLLKNQIIDGNTDLGNQLLYVQGAAGIKTRFKFPDLSLLGKESGRKISINEAKLIIPVSTIDTTTFLPPVSLALVRMKADEAYSTLVDQTEVNGIFAGKYFDGSYDATKNAYQFRITRYVQEMIHQGEDFENFGLQLSVLGASSYPNRMVFNGINPTEEGKSPFQLVVYYTLVN